MLRKLESNNQWEQFGDFEIIKKKSAYSPNRKVQFTKGQSELRILSYDHRDGVKIVFTNEELVKKVLEKCHLLEIPAVKHELFSDVLVLNSYNKNMIQNYLDVIDHFESIPMVLKEKILKLLPVSLSDGPYTSQRGDVVNWYGQADSSFCGEIKNLKKLQDNEEIIISRDFENKLGIAIKFTTKNTEALNKVTKKSELLHLPSKKYLNSDSIEMYPNNENDVKQFLEIIDDVTKSYGVPTLPTNSEKIIDTAHKAIPELKPSDVSEGLKPSPTSAEFESSAAAGEPEVNQSIDTLTEYCESPAPPTPSAQIIDVVRKATVELKTSVVSHAFTSFPHHFVKVAPEKEWTLAQKISAAIADNMIYSSSGMMLSGDVSMTKGLALCSTAAMAKGMMLKDEEKGISPKSYGREDLEQIVIMAAQSGLIHVIQSQLEKLANHSDQFFEKSNLPLPLIFLLKSVLTGAFQQSRIPGIPQARSDEESTLQKVGHVVAGAGIVASVSIMSRSPWLGAAGCVAGVMANTLFGRKPSPSLNQEKDQDKDQVKDIDAFVDPHPFVGPY